MGDQESSPAVEKNFKPVIDEITGNNSLDLKENRLKTVKLFVAVNAAILLSVLILSQGSFQLAFLALLFGAFAPFVMLFLSKFLAKLSHKIEVINPEEFRNETEEQLYNLVKELSQKAGIENTPEVGIYKSPDMNAFATGWSKNDSLVAFSSALLEKMDEKAIAGVAAHEIAHAANGDMLSMTLIQSAVNAIVSLINIGLFIFLDDDEDGFVGRLVAMLIRFAIVTVFMFLGNLVVLWFSRYREFAADALAAKLVDNSAMIGALNFLKNDEDLEVPANIAEEQSAYASFKISSKAAVLDVLCTHPSLERRIEALEKAS
jgi:heat shock protein HtpX